LSAAGGFVGLKLTGLVRRRRGLSAVGLADFAVEIYPPLAEKAGDG
jgi:hypothetical protein